MKLTCSLSITLKYMTMNIRVFFYLAAILDLGKIRQFSMRKSW